MYKCENNVLGKLSPQQFLKEYWQKKPCLIRQAIPDFRCPISPEELAGLACEEGISSRLVIEKDSLHSWQVSYGPLTDEIFRDLPESHWTLLVQEVDHYHPEITALLDYFRFIPNWRIDDVMISYAAKHGSVGPHLDSYDVFLLQGMGKRNWQINPEAYDENDFIPGLDLRIIENFQSTQEWILEPGDMLYLPPGTAHHGVAIEPCMTLSIGFLAPSSSELINHFVEETFTGTLEDKRYSDPALKLQEYPGEITTQSLTSIRKLMRSMFDDDETINQWFGKYITNTNQAEMDETSSSGISMFKKLFKKHEVIYRSGDCRCAFIRNKNNLMLFVNGDEYHLEADDLRIAALITERSLIHINELSDFEKRDVAMKILCALYQNNIYFFDE